MSIADFIQIHPEVVITTVVALCSFLGTMGFIWRNHSATKNSLALQRQELETVKLKNEADLVQQKQAMEAQKVEHEAALAKQKVIGEAREAKQRLEQEAEADRRFTRLQNENKRLYESRIEAQKTQIQDLEADRKQVHINIETLTKRLEKMVYDLNEQKILLQAEKMAYSELQITNEALQRTNDGLVRHEQELMTSNGILKADNASLLSRVEELEKASKRTQQRCNDIEQDNRHKDSQIVGLLEQVLKLEKATSIEIRVVEPESKP